MLRVEVYLPPDLLDDVDEHTENRSEYIRGLIEDDLDDEHDD